MSLRLQKPGEADPDYLCDERAHYRVAIYDRLMEMPPRERREEWAKVLDRQLLQYRPLPQARKFHRSRAQYRWALGGNRCLGPDTLIESPDGNRRRVADIHRPHWVWAWDGTRRVPAEASAPCVKGYEPCYRLHLSSGHSFDCSAEHRVLTGDGFVSIKSVMRSIPASLVGNATIVACEPRGTQRIYDFEVPIWNNYATCGAVHHNSSKSRALVVETLWKLLGAHPFRTKEEQKLPCSGWYAATTSLKTGEMWREHFAPLLHGIHHQVVWHNRQYDVPGMLLIPTSAGISRLTFKMFEQGRESFQASAQDFVHFDEQFGHDIFLESISRIGAEQSAEFAAAMTPIMPQQWLEKRLVIDRNAEDAIFEFPLDDNRLSWGGFIPDERIDSLIEQWPPEVRETRRLGKWGSFLGTIFQTFNRDTHVVSEQKERELFFRDGHGARNFDVVGAIDWGGSNPFCFIWCARIPHLDRDWYCFDIYYHDPKQWGNRRLQQHADEIKARTEKWETRLVRCWSDHDPQDAAEFAGMGIPSIPADKGPGSVRAGIELIQTLLNPRAHLSNANWPAGRPRLHIAARCEDLIRELALYRWAEGTEKRDAKDEPMKIADHSVDCLRYLCTSEEPFTSAPICVDLGMANRRLF